MIVQLDRDAPSKLKRLIIILTPWTHPRSFMLKTKADGADGKGIFTRETVIK